MHSYWISYKISGEITSRGYTGDTKCFESIHWVTLQVRCIDEFEDSLLELQRNLYSEHSSDNKDVENVVILSVSRL